MKIINVLKFSFFTFISRILGLLRDVLISRYLGAGGVSDAFFVAFKIPNLFRKLFAEGSLQAVFIPIFNGLLGVNQTKARQFASSVFAILSISLLILLVILQIYTAQWVGLISPGFKAKNIETFNLTVLLTRITLPYLFFISLATFYSAILNSLGKFALVAFLPALLNISIIIALLFSGYNSAIMASVGVFFGGVLQLLMVAYVCKKAGWLVGGFKINFASKPVKQFFKRLLPVVLGAGVYQVNILVDIAFASLLSFGTISYVFYADRIYQLPLSLIGIAIGSVLLPALSNVALSKVDYIKTINQAMLLGLAFALAATCGLVVFSNNIIYSIYFGGKFMQTDVNITAIMLVIYAFSLPFNVLIKIMLPVFYSKGNVKIPLYSTIIGLVVNVGLLYWLVVIKNNIFGMAYATTVASVLNFIILVVVMYVKLNIKFSLSFFAEVAKIVIITIILTILGLALKPWFLNVSNINIARLILFAIVCIVFVVFVVLLKLFKTTVYNQLKVMFNK